LIVVFENGDEVKIDVRSLAEFTTAPGWDHLTVAPHALTLEVSDQHVDVSWVDIRALSDARFAAYLVDRAGEQARQVGRRLRLLRARRRLSSKELAERAGISPQSLSRIERGRHDVVFATLQRLLAAMSFELADLAQVANVDVEVAPDRIVAALRASGLDRATVRRILHGATDSESMIARVRAIFNWSPTDLAGPSAPPLLGGLALAGRLKDRARNHRAAATYVMYAHKVALLADQAADRPPYDPPPSDPDQLAATVRARYGDLRFASLARYAWDQGIVVVPMFDASQFHGACWLVGDRPAIVLKQRLDYDSRWAFDLGHEICHVVRHLGEAESAIVEFDEIGVADDAQEREASEFAGEILLGDPESLVQQVVRRAGGTGEALKGALPPVARQAGVDVGVLANYLAYRLQEEQSFDFNWWPVAARLQQGDREAPSVARDLLLDRLRWERLADDDAAILRAALAPDPGGTP
ncbi:MAG: hypothetical protein JWL77_7131, partial [Chthonomonadaceae bacterium]|nr:hypothetical protein [Chthonomonadaceae bacterium]